MNNFHRTTAQQSPVVYYSPIESLHLFFHGMEVAALDNVLEALQCRWVLDDLASEWSVTIKDQVQRLHLEFNNITQIHNVLVQERYRV